MALRRDRQPRHGQTMVFSGNNDRKLKTHCQEVVVRNDNRQGLWASVTDNIHHKGQDGPGDIDCIMHRKRVIVVAVLY